MMTAKQFRVVGLTVITLCALPALTNLLTSNIPVPAWLRPYLLSGAVLMVAVLVHHELRQRRTEAGQLTLESVADRLAEAIKKQWSAEAEARQLDEPTALPVPWTVIQSPPFDPLAEVIRLGRQQHSRWPVTAVPSIGHLEQGNGRPSVYELFTSVPTHRLVVLGAGGAGKTGLLIQLVLQLLESQDRDVSWPDRPYQDRLIPVLLPLSSWPTGQHLRDWLVDRLIAEHPALEAAADDDLGSPSRAQALVGKNLVLPILDGFDEIHEPARVSALERISEALRDPGLGIVIASREGEFLKAAELARPKVSVVHGAVAVRLDQLAPGSVRRYLDRYGTAPWRKVLPEVGTGTPVGKVLRTPLMVSLAHAVYNRHEADDGAQPGDLLAFASEEEVSDHLFDSFVPAAYRDRPSRAQPAIRSLQKLAVYLERDQRVCHSAEGDPARNLVEDFEWWRLRDSVPFPVVGLVVGLLPAIAVGLVAAKRPGLGVGLGLGMLSGLAFGAVASMIARHRWRPARPSGSIGTGIAGGFLGALLGAVPTGIILYLTGHAARPVPGLMGALGAGIGVGVCHGRWRGVVSAAVGGVMVPLTAGAGAGLAAGLVDGAGTLAVAAFTVGAVGLTEPSRGVRGMGWSKAGYLTGATVGLSIGTGVALTTSLTSGLIAGSVTASAGGFAAGLEGIPVSRTLADAAAGPAALLARDRGTCWLVAAIAGIGFGLGAGLAVQQLAVGLAAGLTVGIIAATIQASWLPFTVGRWWCAARGQLPFRLMSFLADAHRRGILRQEGGSYQFRHLELQEHLARTSGLRAGDHREVRSGRWWTELIQDRQVTSPRTIEQVIARDAQPLDPVRPRRGA